MRNCHGLTIDSSPVKSSSLSLLSRRHLNAAHPLVFLITTQFLRQSFHGSRLNDCASIPTSKTVSSFLCNAFVHSRMYEDFEQSRGVPTLPTLCKLHFGRRPINAQVCDVRNMRSRLATPETLYSILIHALVCFPSRSPSTLVIHKQSAHRRPVPSPPSHYTSHRNSSAVTSQADGSSRTRDSCLFETKRVQQVHLAPSPALTLLDPLWET